MDPEGPQEGTPEPPMAQTVPPGPERYAYPPPPPPPRRSRWLSVLLSFLLVFSLMANVILFLLLGLTGMGSLDTAGKVRERHFSHQRGAPDKVAIISIEGTIIDPDGFVKRQIDQVRKDPSIKAVVVRVDSPGGTVTASDYLYHHLTELRKDREIPMVVSMGGLAASGGYYVSMAVGDTPNSIFAEPTTWTGSIGVIIPHYDLSEMLGNWGIEQDSISSHRLKGMGSFAKPMTEEERAIFQQLVDDSFDRFKKVVQSGRPKFAKNPTALDELATGQVFTADQAKKDGLVDKIGFIEAAVDRAIELAKLNKDKVSVIRYEPEPTLANLLIGAQAKQQGFDVEALLDLTAPRAYYLCTWLPPISSSPQQ